MYRKNGTYYTEEHSVSFGDIITTTRDGVTYTDFETQANSWEDWHLIPSSLPVIANPTIVTKYVEIPGMNGMLDLTEYLKGSPVYGQRQGTLSFYVDNGHDHWETIRQDMVALLHGKVMKLRLMDDPGYYYQGRFTVGNWEPGADYSKISITYQLDTYKLSIQASGGEPVIWDTFNFETDYDYSVLYPSVSVTGSAKRFDIRAEDFPITVIVNWVSGSVVASFGNVTRTISSTGSYTLGTISNRVGTLTLSGNGTVSVMWRGGSL